jgi:hypothetical protein
VALAGPSREEEILWERQFARPAPYRCLFL